MLSVATARLSFTVFLLDFSSVFSSTETEKKTGEENVKDEWNTKRKTWRRDLHPGARDQLLLLQTGGGGFGGVCPTTDRRE